MNIVLRVFDFVIHVDTHLAALVAQYGLWTHLLLALVVFCETGLVVTPFLPGDSLLFVAGAVAAGGALNVHAIFVLLAAAAFLGNSVNYAVGRWLGRHFFTDRGSRWLNPAHLEKAHAFYERHGGPAVVISRFVPIVRTYVPFVAGMGAMEARAFLLFNAGGAVLWVGGLAYAGYFFGNIPWIRGNLTAIIVGIVVVSVLPVAWALARARLAKT